MAENGVLLELENLSTSFYTDEGVVPAVKGVSYRIGRGKTLGVVGESGCGKSVTALSILRLVPDPPGKIIGGRILFEGRDLVSLPERDMRKIRGNEISMIFQEPMTSLNPVFTVGNQIQETILLHQKTTFRQAKTRAIEMLDIVRIPSPDQRYHEYPHQLSGGMKQRVMIAMALACRPKLLIADEPTTALDVTIQAQILELMRDLQREFGMSILLITHDLGVIAEMADEVVVMYAGEVAEKAPVETLFERPRHPYTLGLMASRPQLGREVDVLPTIPGAVPHPSSFPKGCKFHPRCPQVEDVCKEQDPRSVEIEPGHRCACHPVTREFEAARAPGKG